MDKQTKITVTKLPNNSTLIIRQHGDRGMFVSSDNVIVIEISTLAFLIKFLISNKFMSKKVLEGILSEISE